MSTTTFVLVGGHTQTTAEALTRLAQGRVAYTASIGDAASPVYVQAGPHRSSHGQVADYRHDVAAWAGRQGIASVCGWWSDVRGWCHTVELPEGVTVDAARLAREAGAKPLADLEASEAAAHRRLVAGIERHERERPAREARAAAHAAIVAGLEDEYRPLRDAALAAGAAPGDVEYAWGKATRRTGYAGYEQERGVRLLRRLAGLEPATA